MRKVSELYSYLTQTASKPAYILAGAYNQVGELTTANLNIISDDVVLPQLNATANTTGVQADLQGRMRYLGINLANVRGDRNDTPNNAIMVGQSPMVLRISRNSGSGGSDEPTNNAETKSACNMNIWVECVKALVIRNGVIDTIDL